jgi:tRNA(Glu) U13 pseudouridine synthase TruD
MAISFAPATCVAIASASSCAASSRMRRRGPPPTYPRCRRGVFRTASAPSALGCVATMPSAGASSSSLVVACLKVLGVESGRLLVSAFQSMLFNRFLERRLEEGLLRTALAGDVLRKRVSGGLFIAEESELAQAASRLETCEIDVTGPMFGPEMRQPRPGSVAALREVELLKEEGLDLSSFAHIGRLGEGTRRPLTVPVGEATVGPGMESNSIVLQFILPPGAYATVLLDEVMKPSAGMESGVTLF